MPHFAANLSMLWPELDVYDRFRAAAEAGFSRVEILFVHALDQERVANRFNLGPVEAWKDFAKQLAMFLQQFLRKLVVALRQRAVAYHVGKHDGCQPALFGGAHLVGPCKSFWKRGSLRSGSHSGSKRRSARVIPAGTSRRWGRAAMAESKSPKRA